MHLRPRSYRAFLGPFGAPLIALAVLASAACSESNSDTDKSLTGGTLKVQLALGTAGRALASGAAEPSPFGEARGTAPGVESLKYHLGSIQICEDMDITGSGYQNPRGCLSVYDGDRSGFEYDPSSGDWTPLADHARTTDEGFIDLMNAASRAGLAASAVLTREHVRAYKYGMINWALPVKVKASVAHSDGTMLYSHDGTTVVEIVGADRFRNYTTLPSAPLTQAPAEEAVVLLGNGGNWFKFQAPLTITEDDIVERRAWVLDLVFNPDGIMKGTSGTLAQISERDAMGTLGRGIAVPMLDLAPVPHRSTETVVRESYVGPVSTGSNGFDLRVELYSVEGDPSHTIYGVDIKTIVSSATAGPVPDVSKVSYVEAAGDAVSFLSWSHLPFMTGFRRGTAQGATTTASIVCAVHSDRSVPEGAAAIVVERCPAATIEVPFTLVSRTTVSGSTAIGVGGGPDASAD